jgi:hypothetical protein
MQNEVNDLVYRHGSNVPNWSNWPALLTERGMVPGDVTPGMLGRAEHHLRQELVRKAQELNEKRGVLRMVVVGDPATDPAHGSDPAPGYNVDLVLRHREAILKMRQPEAVVAPPAKPWTRGDSDSLRDRIKLTLSEGDCNLEELASSVGASPDWTAVHLAALVAKGEVTRAGDDYCLPE